MNMLEYLVNIINKYFIRCFKKNKLPDIDTDLEIIYLHESL